MAGEKSEEMKPKEQNVLEGETCPFCHKKTLTLMERHVEVPYFGELAILSMDCSNCGYHKADIDSLEDKEPCKYTLEISSEDDLSIRIIKSAEATVKLPHMTSIEPGPASNGYITNVEGILNRVKHRIESLKEESEDPAAKKKAKNLLKKLQKVMWGQEKQKIIVEDPSGNSAIISDKAVKEPFKSKKK